MSNEANMTASQRESWPLPNQVSFLLSFQPNSIQIIDNLLVYAFSALMFID